MWRIFNGIPRAIRAHFHGPRAATGANCVEEESCIVEVETESNRTVYNCQRAEHDCGHHESNWQTSEHHKPDGRQFHSACRRWQHKEHDESTSWTQDNFKQHDHDENLDENNGRRNSCHQHWKQADHEDRDWWKRQSCRNDFWSLFCGNHNAMETLTFGAAVVLGLQLSRPRWRDKYLHDGSREGHRRSSFLYQVAFALPRSKSSRRSIRSSNIVTQSKAPPLKDETSKLDKVMKDFQASCSEYTALGKSIVSLQNIESGNMTTAVKRLREASSLGHASSQYNLGLCYELGEGVEKDLDKAMEYYERAGDSGHAEALYNLAVMQEDDDKMINLLEKAAELGLAQAQTYLGTYYSESEDPADKEKTVEYFKAAAEQNDAEAQCFLGMCYERGIGVEVNECKAAELYHKAAQAENDSAMYNLAVFHEHGLGGLAEDKISALELYNKAAQAGNEHAQFRLDEIKAKSAVDDWKVLYGDDEPESRSSILSTSTSSPSISDYVRQHLNQLSFTFSENISSLETTDQESDTSSTRIRRKKKPQFSLGENDIDNDDYMYERQNGLLTLSSLNPSSNCSVLGMGRNTTMPELGYIPCP